MRTEQAAPIAKRLDAYSPPDFLVDRVRLTFRLDPREAIVTARLSMRRSETAAPDAPLVLDGEKLTLRRIALDGEALAADCFETNEAGLAVPDVPNRFELETEVAIDPEGNTALSGLYLTSGLYCTQCEAEGFRRITYYPDRPDVLSRFDVRIEASEDVPVLLVNGNPGEAGALPDGRHFAEWSDPHPKPAYLFALVGGALSRVEDRFTTMSGREVTLCVFVAEKDLHRCAYALDALKRAMRWDEEVFGREYDLDLFMIVAVDHFNFGAMENKGLNVFNASCVLASPETATDQDYETIESIVAHEYFHNWSGNRVTCRDWFQLCLKEGFTVFRDQEFSADQRSRAVQRIKDVRQLRARQFPEDASPLAHPVRPPEYVAIDNFYTATVYDKGAELVRMLKTLLGAEAFREACDDYFETNDGTAATVEDFLSAMERVSSRDLSRFAQWYARAGTPELHVTEAWDEANGRHELTLRQVTADGAPRHMPIRVGLLGDDGEAAPERVVEMTEATHTVVTEGLLERPLVSLPRGFSAPVRVVRELTTDQRLSLIERDGDAFCRWSEAQGLAADIAASLGASLRPTSPRDGGEVADAEAASRRFGAALARIAGDDRLEPAYRAEMLRLPAAPDLARLARAIDPERIVAGRDALRGAVLAEARSVLTRLHDELSSDEPYRPSAAEAGRRALRNTSLGLLLADGSTEAGALALAQAKTATNMTDEAAATASLAATGLPQRQAALTRFYERWQDDALVLNKWFAWQAAHEGPAAIEALTAHPAFELTNPNKVRALIGVFAAQNLDGFHSAGGEGYDLFFGFVRRLDSVNPQVASRLLTATESWRRVEPKRKALLRAHLEGLAGTEGLSANLSETAERLTR